MQLDVSDLSAQAVAMRGVMITGRGCVSPLGIGVSRTAWGLLSNEIAIRPAPWRQRAQGHGLWWTTVPRFEPSDWVQGDVLRGTDRFSQFAIACAQQALDEAGIAAPPPCRTAVVHGTSLAAMPTLLRAQHVLDLVGAHAIDRKTIIKFWPNMAAAQIALRWGLHGPLMTLSSACAASVDAIGTAARMIAERRADVAIAGGTEGGFCLPDPGDPFIPANFLCQAIYGLETREEDRLRAVLPFDRNRSGIATGDGSAIVVIESAEHAAARGADPLAEIVGYASLSDGYHPSSPDPSGTWEAATMLEALADACLEPRDVDAVIAHATGTEKGDAAEIRALNRVFRRRPPPVTSLKGHIGHTGAAAGAMNVLAGLHALAEGFLPNVGGTADVDPEADFDVIIDRPRMFDGNVIQVNAFGLGGQNASLVIRRA